MEEMRRICKKCGVEKSHSEFAKHKQCKFGITHECSVCALKRSQYRTPDKLAMKSEYDKRRYERSSKRQKIDRESDPAKYKLSTYKSFDKKRGINSDIDYEFVLNAIDSPCFYCGLKDKQNVGLDRIENSIGHMKSNVVPCCSLCNMTRGDRFTHEDFKEFIAPSIAKFREANKC